MVIFTGMLIIGVQWSSLGGSEDVSKVIKLQKHPPLKQSALKQRTGFSAATKSLNIENRLATTTTTSTTTTTVPPTTTTTTIPIVTTTTTQPPPIQAAPIESNSYIWNCIISHESQGNPTVVNSRSGAGGLFQFLPSSWKAYGGTVYSTLPEDATVAEQWDIAIKAQAESGWSPWRGDGCTPVG